MTKPRFAALSLALAFTVLLPAVARAQHPAGPRAPKDPRDALSFVQSELLTLYVPGMSNSPDVLKNGKKVDVGFFGGGVEAAFAGSPRALEEARRMRTYRLVGAPLWIAGMAALVVDLVLLGARHSSVVQGGDVKALAYGLLAGGAAFGLTGAFLVQGANARLSDAVRYYNDDVFARARQRFSVGILPVPGGAMAGVGASF